MSIEATIQTRLASQVALVADANIRTPGDWQDLALPYISHFRVSGGGTVHVHGAAVNQRDHDFYQVSVFASSWTNADAIEKQILTALDGYRAAGVQLVRFLETFPNYED